MDLEKVKKILDKYGIAADFDSPSDVYYNIQKIGDPLSLEEHTILFNTFWELENKRRGSDVKMPDSLKIKFILGRENLSDFAPFIFGIGLDASGLIPEIIRRFNLGSREQEELWRIFHNLHQPFSTRDSDQIDKELGVYKIIEYKLERLSRINVLDLGCGKSGSGISSLVHKYGERVRGFGIDVNIEERLPSVRLIKGTIERLPFPENYFDVIYASHVIYYFSEEWRLVDVIREALRVLKSGGMFVFNGRSDNIIYYSKIIIPKTGIRARVFLVKGFVFLIVKY